MFGTTPINHASRSLSREWTGWTTGPFIGELVTLLLGINYRLPGNDPSTNLFSGEYHLNTIKEWWKWILLNEYLIVEIPPSTTNDISFLFPTWYPFKNSKASDVYFVDIKNNRVHLDVALEWKTRISIDPQYASVLDNIRLFDSTYQYYFSSMQTRFLIEYNIPRKVFTRCFSYDFTNNNNNNTTIAVNDSPLTHTTTIADDVVHSYTNTHHKSPVAPNRIDNTFQLHRSGSFTKIAETGLLPFQIDNMEFNVNNLMNDPLISCKHNPLFANIKSTTLVDNETDSLGSDEQQSEELLGAATHNSSSGHHHATTDIPSKNKSISLSSLKSQSSMIKWNIFSVLKANITPLHVILVYINNIVSEWENTYTHIILERGGEHTHASSLFEELKDEGDNNDNDELLNAITLQTLYTKRTNSNEWIFKYQIYHDSLYRTPTRIDTITPAPINSISSGSTTSYDDFNIVKWTYNHCIIRSFPLCTDTITASFKEFIPFTTMINSPDHSHTGAEPEPEPDSTPTSIVCSWAEEVISQLMMGKKEDSLTPIPDLNQKEGTINRTSALQDIKDVLGENTPFYNFIVCIKPCYSKFKLFWKFLFSITFLSVIIKKSQLVSRTQTTKVLAKDVISTPFLDLFLNTKSKRESLRQARDNNTSSSAYNIITSEDREKEWFDYTHARVIITACHEYLTCFLPLAHFFKTLIEKGLISAESIRDNTPIESSTRTLSPRCWDSLMDKHIASDMVHVLMPYPERSMEWTDTPDIRNLIQNIRFTHKTIDGDNTNAIVSMFQKALPFRSQGRSIGSKTSHCCNESNEVNGLFYYIIRNSLLGMYSDSTLGFGYNKMASGGRLDGSVYICNDQLPLLFRPSLGTMLCYYELFFNEQNGHLEHKREKLTEWIQSDSKICALVIREFLVSLISLQPQYAESQPSINWKNFWQRSIILGNLIRTTVENSIKVLYTTGGIIKREDLLPGLEKKYTFIFSSQGGFDAVAAKQPFTDKLCSIFKDYNETVIIDGVILRGEIPMLEQFLVLLQNKKLMVVGGGDSDETGTKTIHRNDRMRDTNTRISVLSAAIADLDNTIRMKRMALEACEFDLSSKAKNAIWSGLFGIKRKKRNDSDSELITTEDLQKHGIFNFISEKESKILYMMIDMCGKNVYPKGIPELMSQFSYIGFKTLYFVLESVYILQSIQLVMLDSETTENIERAMQKRFDIITDQVLPEKAYHIYYTLCCRRVASFHPSIRNYGNESIIYDPYRRSYVCGKKKLKKSGDLLVSSLVNKVQMNAAKTAATLHFFKNYQRYLDLIEEEEEEGEEICDDNPKIKSTRNARILSDDICELYRINKELFPFQFLTKKAKKKVARTIRRKTQLDCLRNPEVLTIDLKGYRLIEGRPDKKKKAYQHCPKCGHFHKYNDRYWAFGSGEYTCSHCWTENTTFVAKCGYCNKYEVKRPDRISSVNSISVPFYRGVDSSLKSDTKNNTTTTNTFSSTSSNNGSAQSTARIWLSGIDTVKNLRRSEIMHTNNQTVDSTFYKKYNTIISDVGKFFEEPDGDDHAPGGDTDGSIFGDTGSQLLDGFDYNEDGENGLDEDSFDAMEAETYIDGGEDEGITHTDSGIVQMELHGKSKSEYLSTMDMYNVGPPLVSNLEKSDGLSGLTYHQTAEYAKVDMRDMNSPYSDQNGQFNYHDRDNQSTSSKSKQKTKSKERLRYRCKGKTSKRFGINRSTAGVSNTRSSSAKHEELSPKYAIREASMVERCEVEKLTERMFKSLRRTGRTFLIDLGIPSSFQVKLMMDAFLNNAFIDRSKLIEARVNTHFGENTYGGGPSEAEQGGGGIVFMHFFDLMYTLHVGRNEEEESNNATIINNQFATFIKEESTIPIIVSSLCDRHAPNMSDLSYSIEGTVRKRKYITQTVPSSMKDTYKHANEFQILFNYGLLYREEYYRAIEKKRMNACVGTGGYYGNNKIGRSYNFKRGRDTTRDKTTRKLLDVLLTRTIDTHNKKTKLKADSNQAMEQENKDSHAVPQTPSEDTIPVSNNNTQGTPRAKKKKQKAHWLSVLERSKKKKSTPSYGPIDDVI